MVLIVTVSHASWVNRVQCPDIRLAAPLAVPTPFSPLSWDEKRGGRAILIGEGQYPIVFTEVPQLIARSIEHVSLLLRLGRLKAPFLVDHVFGYRPDHPSKPTRFTVSRKYCLPNLITSIGYSFVESATGNVPSRRRLPPLILHRPRVDPPVG